MGLTPENLILWVDPALVVVNKPAGMLTLPDGYNPDLPHLRSILEPSLGRLWIIHRLDKETSGVIVLARSAEAHRHLNTQFQDSQVAKAYHALVTGNPPWDTYTVDLPLRANVGHHHRTVVDKEKGKPAITILRVIQRFIEPGHGDYALVEATPKTGRTHQVRVHLFTVGFPPVADPLYGDEIHTAYHRLTSLGLHARSLTIQHPQTGEIMKFEAPYYQDWVAALGLEM